MEPTADPLPLGTMGQHPVGPEEVLVVRIADPVHVRRPGEASSYPLHFYSKQSRMNAGTWVFSGSGGRLEVLYPENTSIMLYGLGSGVVGSESRGEPIFFFRELDRVCKPGAVLATRAEASPVRANGLVARPPIRAYAIDFDPSETFLSGSSGFDFDAGLQQGC